MRRTKLTRERVLQRLGELAFGRANDVVKLALLEEAELQERIDGLDLSVLAEFRRGDKGVEIKVVDRVKALEELFGLLDGGKDERDKAEQFFRALKDSARAEENEDSEVI